MQYITSLPAYVYLLLLLF